MDIVVLQRKNRESIIRKDEKANMEDLPRKTRYSPKGKMTLQTLTSNTETNP